MDLALHGGDDYEICFTIAAEDSLNWLKEVENAGVIVYQIGLIQASTGLYAVNRQGEKHPLQARGYNHFGV